jgi:hypothetical protein
MMTMTMTMTIPFHQSHHALIGTQQQQPKLPLPHRSNMFLEHPPQLKYELPPKTEYNLPRQLLPNLLPPLIITPVASPCSFRSTTTCA